MQEVFIVDAVRTPVGKIGGALSSIRPDDMAAGVLSALLKRHAGLDPAGIDDIYFGNGNGAGEENRNVARMAALLAGIPCTVPGVTANRLCGSGLEAVLGASREIATGDADLCIAGGVESMSRAPWVVMKPERPYERTHREMHSTTLGWRLTNPALPKEWTVPLGEGAELLADRYNIDRDTQDRFALRSHRLADGAWRSGAFDHEVVAVTGSDLSVDECIRSSSTMDTMSSLRTVFRDDGTVTAGNASPMNDGASAILLASPAALETHGLKPLARVVSRAVAGVEPHLFGIGPVTAADQALMRAGLKGWSDVNVVELNEAFAAQALACMAEWPELDPELVNPNGGSIAIGHPVGASGARITTTLVHELSKRGGFGVATMCIGVGQGVALVLEAV